MDQGDKSLAITRREFYGALTIPANSRRVLSWPHVAGVPYILLFRFSPEQQRVSAPSANLSNQQEQAPTDEGPVRMNGHPKAVQAKVKWPGLAF